MPDQVAHPDLHRLSRSCTRSHVSCGTQVCRLRWDPRTRAYAQRRTAEGMSRKEIIRCLKRYVAREVYTALLNPLPSSVPASTCPA